MDNFLDTKEAKNVNRNASNSASSGKKSFSYEDVTILRKIFPENLSLMLMLKNLSHDPDQVDPKSSIRFACYLCTSVLYTNQIT